MKFINEVVAHFAKCMFQGLVSLNVLLEMACVIMNQKVWVHLGKGHSVHQEVGFLFGRFIHGMLLGCHYPFGVWIQHELPASSPVLQVLPFFLFVGACACAFIPVQEVDSPEDKRTRSRSLKGTSSGLAPWLLVSCIAALAATCTRSLHIVENPEARCCGAFGSREPHSGLL